MEITVYGQTLNNPLTLPSRGEGKSPLERGRGEGKVI
jgi:hypothetical protein